MIAELQVFGNPSGGGSRHTRRAFAPGRCGIGSRRAGMVNCWPWECSTLHWPSHGQWSRAKPGSPAEPPWSANWPCQD